MGQGQETARRPRLVGEWVDEQRELREQLEEIKAAILKARQEWFSVKGVAALTGLSTKRIRRAIKRGELVVSNAGSDNRALYRIGRQDIETWISSMRLKQG